jgi:hypothetical protein
MAIVPLDASNADAAFDFLDTMVARRGREHWRWKYGAQPSEGPHGFQWREADGRVLGFIGLMRTALYAGVKQHAAAWFVDWHVVPGDRGVGVGFALLRKAEAAAGILLTLQGSADTRRILPRLGWRESAQPETWVLPLTARFISATAAARIPPWSRRVLAPIAALARPYFRVSPEAAIPSATLIAVERIPAEYDAVWRARAPQFSPTLSRDAAYLNYLCGDYPGGGYVLRMLAREDRLIGHVVWRLDTDRRGYRRGRIVDMLWPRTERDLAARLVQSASWELQRAGADYIDMVISIPELREVLRANRFRRRGHVSIWYHRLPTDAPNPGTWHISFADCDRGYR